MKKIQILALTLFLSTFAYSQNNMGNDYPKYEIMNVEIYFLSGLTGIYISN